VKQLYARLLRGGWARERGTVELGMMIAAYERTNRPLTPNDSPTAPQ